MQGVAAPFAAGAWMSIGTFGNTTTFTYDDIGQLLSESSSGYSTSYTYDENGNRATRTVNGVTETYTVDDADKLTSVTWSQGGNNYEKAYSYHWSGRPTSIVYRTNGSPTATRSFTWNKEQRLTAMTAPSVSNTYGYNGLNTRVTKSDISGSFTYKRTGAHQTAPVLYDGSAGYLPGISEKRSGTTTFLHSGIKNGVLQTNTSQSNTATNRYDALGNILVRTGTWKGPFEYGGKFGYQADVDDIFLLGDRYYDPSVGRFLTRDAAKDGRNWYAYGAGLAAPVAGADPSGRELFTIIVIVAGAAALDYGLKKLGDSLSELGEAGRENREWREQAFWNGDPTSYGYATRAQAGILEEVRLIVADETREKMAYQFLEQVIPTEMFTLPFFPRFTYKPRKQSIYDVDRNLRLDSYGW